MKRRLLALTYPGWAILAAALALCLLGVLCIFAADPTPLGLGHAGVRQMILIAVSMGLGLVLLRIGYQQLGRVAYLLFGAGLALLVVMVVARLVGSLPLIRPIKSTYRWIQFPGFALQPSEVMKVAYVVGLAWFLRHRDNVRRFSGLLGPFALTIIPMCLVLLQPDLGTALLLMPVLFVMLFAAGARLRHFAIIVLLALVSVPVLWLKILEPYQKDRIAGLLLQSSVIRERVLEDPQAWAWLCRAEAAQHWEQRSGYQLIGSLGALGNGGFTGRGWRQGTYVRYDFLPAKQNDFIFAIIGEQWGFLGCVGVLCCFGVILLAGLEIAVRTPDPFGRLLAVGVVALFATQTLINVGMTMGLTPITGMNLPFVSSGGSNSVANFLLVSLVINVSQNRPFLLARKPFEGGEPQYVGAR